MSSYMFKVVLLGEGCVGKTSLALRYVSNVFNDSHQSTLQASFLKKQLYVDQDMITLSIWDTAGQERYHALGPIYYRDADGALLVYDVTNPDSLRRVRVWIKELNKILGTESIKLAVIGNKVDLLPQSERIAPHTNLVIQDALQLADTTPNAKHYLSSAKNNVGIGELFLSLSKRMVEHSKKQSALKKSRNSHNSRFSKTLSVTEDELSDTNIRNSNRRINLNATNDRDGDSCRCWK